MPRRKGPKPTPQVTESPNALDSQPPSESDGTIQSSGNMSSHTNGGSTQARLSAFDISPMTPPRPRSMYDSPSIYEGSYSGPRSGNVSASENASPKNRRSSKAHKKRQSGSLLTPRTNGISHTKKPNYSEGPRIPSITPTQAYAGPTFHASPAPSSLPIPKFYSKSVPEVDKAKTLADMMANESSEREQSPESSEGSPLQEKAQRSNQQAREESPLEIFFKADREEKARARQGSSENVLLSDTPNVQAARTYSPQPESPSPARHHSRHDTGGSSNGLFTIELDDGGPDGQTNLADQPTHPGSVSRANSAPVHTINQAERNEALKREVCSLALKKLLMSPQPERPNPTTSKSADTSVNAGKITGATPAPESSRPFTPTPISGAEVRILSRNQPASLPQLQKQFGSSLVQNGSPRPRPPSSNLRQQLSAPQSPLDNGVPELPSTPTPSRINGIDPKPKSRNVHNPQFSPLRSTAFWGVDSPSGNSTIEVSSMENELRRVLKLDTLGSDGANGVRS